MFILKNYWYIPSPTPELWDDAPWVNALSSGAIVNSLNSTHIQKYNSTRVTAIEMPAIPGVGRWAHRNSLIAGSNFNRFVIIAPSSSQHLETPSVLTYASLWFDDLTMKAIFHSPITAKNAAETFASLGLYAKSKGCLLHVKRRG